MTTHKQFIEMLPKVAADSHDPDTQTAAIVVGWRRTLTASNGIPNLLAVTPERTSRPAKYQWIMHAERRVLAECVRAGVATNGATMYLNWFPCSDCAQMIIAAGIRVLDADKAAYEARKDDPRYGFAVAMEMLREAGITIRWH